MKTLISYRTVTVKVSGSKIDVQVWSVDGSLSCWDGINWYPGSAFFL